MASMGPVDDVRMDDDADLEAALATSQRLGMLGARPIDEVVEHARSFVRGLADVSGVVVDLGTGGGVPGLVIAVDRPDLRLVLVDRRTTRTDHVERLVRRLGLEARVTVRGADTATLAAEGLVADAAVARSFAPPLVTMAAAAPLVRVGGLLLVSEPPRADSSRWPPAAVAALGWAAVGTAGPVMAFRRLSAPGP